MQRASGLVRSAVQAVRPKAVQAVRNMASSEVHAAEGAKLWKNISLGGIALCVVVGAYEYKVHLDHHHGPQYEDEKNLFPYRKMRAKPFPWTCSDCGLFETECWKACKAGQ